MNLNFICTYWGLEHLSPQKFINKITDAGYDGIEICLPPDDNFCTSLMTELEDIYKKNADFIFIPQQLISPNNENINAFFMHIFILLCLHFRL